MNELMWMDILFVMNKKGCRESFICNIPQTTTKTVV
jgi:hypothetical protein